MIPKILKDRAEALGLKVTRKKDRPGMFEIRPIRSPKNTTPTAAGDEIGIMNWLAGARWAVIRWGWDKAVGEAP